MAHPRIEEVEDEVEEDVSDPEEMDLEEFDFARPQGSLQSQAPMDPASTQISPAELQRILGGGAGDAGTNPAQMQQSAAANEKERQRIQREQMEKTKGFQCIYPIYFDAKRTREQGRRVGKEDAVENPLARTIVDALQHIGQTQGVMLQAAFEPMKTHPKDWANPGRVRVAIKQDGKPMNAKVKSSKSRCSAGTASSRCLLA